MPNLQEIIATEVDRQLRRVLGTLRVPVMAQQNGTPVSDGHRTLNFRGAGVTVSDDPAGRRTDIFIPGAPTSSSSTVVNSAAGAGKMFQLGTEPSGWQNPGFSDAAWSASVAETATPPTGAIAGTTWIAPVNANVGVTDTFLHRLTFTLGSGTLTGGTLDIKFNDIAKGVWINGTLVYADPTVAGDGIYFTPEQTLSISSSLLVAGGSNVLAIKVQNNNSVASPYAVDYQLTVNLGSAGVDPIYELVAHKDAANGYASLDSSSHVPTAELGSGTASSTTFLRGDHTWAAASTNAVTVEELDGTPTVTATTLEFPNGTLTDHGGGVVEYTPAAVAAEPYVNVQDQKTSGTGGGSIASGSWVTRTLNTLVTDTGSIASLASNRITLPAGTYRAMISVPGHKVSGHVARLQNVTDGTTVLTGTSEYATSTTPFGQTRSVIAGQFILSGSKALEVQHQVETTNATDGGGHPASFSAMVYTMVEIWKVA